MTILPAFVLGVGLLFNPGAATAPDAAKVEEEDAVEQVDEAAAEAEELEGAAETEAAAEDADGAPEETDAQADEAYAEVDETDVDVDSADTEEVVDETEALAEEVEDEGDEVKVGAGPDEPGAVGPATDTPVEEATVEPTEVPETEVAAADDPDVASEEEEDDDEEKPSKPWSLSVGHDIGFGLQVDEALSYYYGQLKIGGSYQVSGPIRVGANLGVYYTPDSQPRDARQLDLAGASVSLSHGNIFHDEVYTDVRVSGQIQVALPISMAGRAFGNYPTMGGSISLARSVGSVNLSYGMRFNKFNPKSEVAYLPLCVEDRGANAYCITGYETSWQMGHSIRASYSPIEDLSLSASFGSMLTRTFAPSKHDPAMTPEYMHDVRANVRDNFAFSLSAGYEIIDSLTASVSLSNGGPWRSNGQDIYNPLFDSRLAAMSVGVSYSY